MTDPNKAAVTESNAEFIAEMKTFYGPQFVHVEDFKRLLALAEERVMIEEQQISVIPPRRTDDEVWCVEWHGRQRENKDLSTAIRSVVAKIGEGK